MKPVIASAANMQFEYGQFDWPEYEDRRVVHSTHVLSMTELMPTTRAEGWHELGVGLSPPSPLGSILMAPAAVPFHTRGNGGLLKVARLQFRPADNDLDTLSRERDPHLLQDCLNIRCPDVAHGMRRMIRETLAPGFASDIALEAIGTTILVDILRYLRRSREETQVSARLSIGELQRVYDYVQAHLTRRITITELAALSGISERHFMRLFRAGTGETVHRFVERQRFEKAKLLLDESNQPLKQIAHLLGFSSRVGFTLAFQRIAGQSPQEYRRQRARRNRS